MTVEISGAKPRRTSATPLPAAAPGIAEGASVVVLDGASVLLVRRGKGAYAGLWSLPGGRLEAGETARAAARRELLEETGLSVMALRPLGRFRPTAAFRLSVFVAMGTAGRIEAGSDAAEAAFVPLGSLGTLPTTPKLRRWIGRAIRVRFGGVEREGA